MLQARAKLPKKRRRVLPVEQPRALPRQPGANCPHPAMAPGGQPAGIQNRRMNAIKTNHPKDMITPRMGMFLSTISLFRTHLKHIVIA